MLVSFLQYVKRYVAAVIVAVVAFVLLLFMMVVVVAFCLFVSCAIVCV